MTNHTPFPSIAANASFKDSALVHALHQGINPTALDALAQTIGRLTLNGTTVVPLAMETDLQEMAQLGYLSIEPNGETLDLSLVSSGPQLSSYFWSVWVPRHLQSIRHQFAVMPNLLPGETQLCTVVFLIPGPREAMRVFLNELATRFPGDEADIIAIQAGNALAGKHGG
ncbi:hypothetical protein C5U62_32180 [Pseudomonas protegens]|uniref:Uncharacterized protein n=1 Tax=Pseudomonas protegens TaxID=380021 RepID=A0A2T6GB57_9PSED|nr:hypothetical protein [Pseudomonas protegens]PUA41383.1 hypothetical protein C5U62_32180 [Pseudomonas protegens]